MKRTKASRTLGLARTREFGFVSLYDHFLTTKLTRGRSHTVPDSVAKVPRGFHAAAERPLKLAGTQLVPTEGGISFAGRFSSIGPPAGEPEARNCVTCYL